MSNRDEYNYSDLDNFDDGYDSRDFRRRQPVRRQGSYNRRPVQRTSQSYPQRRPNNSRRKAQSKRRTRNRAIIITVALVLIIVLAALIAVMFKGCGSSNTESAAATVSKEIISKQETTVAVEPTTSAPQTNAQGDLSPTYFKTPTIEDDNTNGELYYSIYVWNQAGYELFGGTESSGETYADTINTLAEKLSGITVYDLIIPNHTEYGLPQRLKDSDATSTSQADNIKAAYAKLSNSVTPINAYNYLADHNTEYIYFNSDHHWTGLGAYYAYKAFADTNGLTALSLEDCTEQTIEGFTGTFANNASGLSTDTVHYWELPYDVSLQITNGDGNTYTNDSPYYSLAASGSLTYGVFILGDNPLTVMTSSSEQAEKGKKIAVVKESYGNAFVPYLTYNYEEVHVVDLRTFRDYETDLATYCKQNDIDEVLFINGVMSANTQTQLDSMLGLVE